MVFNPVARYANWLHLQWPAGKVEKLPRVNEDGTTNVQGVHVVGDLTGVPLLKFSADTGAKAVRRINGDASFQKRTASSDVLDLAIVGGGVSGFSAALEAEELGLNFELYEASQPFSTIVNFPKGKPIYTYPNDMTPDGKIQFDEKSDVKEGLLEQLKEQTLDKGITTVNAVVDHVKRSGGGIEVHFTDGTVKRAHRVVIAIGRSGNYRKLNVPGEGLDKVSNRLHDPKDYNGKNVLVVGGGDSALEGAIAIAEAGGNVTLSYRKPEFSRPKPENVQQLNALAEAGSLRLMMASQVKEITDNNVIISSKGQEDQNIDNDYVFAMIGREAPLDFFRRSGIPINGEWRIPSIIGFILFVAFCIWMYHWKKDYAWSTGKWVQPNTFWLWVEALQNYLGAMVRDKTTLLGTLRISMGGAGFYYTFAYSTAVTVFGVRRILRRKTPYITIQTLTLMAIQVFPLFILPLIVLPYMGNNGLFDAGFMKWLADGLFPEVGYGHGREYWRAFGFVLAWPLFLFNIFTGQPTMMWFIISMLQTFVIIPLMIWRWGKGSYCGWICSCGALAETLGDNHRHKMPHGPIWNKLNMIGQVFLWVALSLFALHLIMWGMEAINVSDTFTPYVILKNLFGVVYEGKIYVWNEAAVSMQHKDIGGVFKYLNYVWIVDLLFAGIIGVAFYFHFSGRVWCRFACPLAALMHIYARFSQFRILVEQKKCISCNVCTSVCHQGIDIMNFANKGNHMEDPECVRCSACVQSCPTGVLSFGRVDKANNIIGRDKIQASPVIMANQITINGQPQK